MEEKVLIKSSSSKTTKKIFIGAIVVSLFVAVSFFLIKGSLDVWLEHNHNFDYWFWNTYIFSLYWLFIILAGIFGLIYFLLSRCNIIVTDKNISGRTFWGKKVVLPIHMVSAYSTSKVFSVLAITTASGFIKFPCIGNREEIAGVLQQLLNERQQKTETQEVLISKEDNSKNLNDLVKLKNLLDDGIITQEEFDAKKKEILGL